MSIRLDLLDRDGTFIKTLEGWSAPMWNHPRRGTEGCSFTLRNDHPDYEQVTGQAGWWRFIRCHLDNVPVFTWQILRHPADRLVDSPAGRGGEVTDVTGLGALAELGMSDFHSALVVGQKDSGFRVFGWVTSDFNWTGTVGALESGGQQGDPRDSTRAGAPEGFPEPLAEWLWTNSARSGTAWVHHDLDGFTGSLTLYLSGDATVWIDGEELLSSDGVGVLARRTVELDDSLMAVRFDGEAIWALLDGDDNTVFASTTGDVFAETEDEVQQVILDPDQPPFPWGSDYPSPGGLEGTWNLIFGGATTADIQWDASAADVKSALEALSAIDVVTVAGSGTSADPWIVTFSGDDVSGQSQPLLKMLHDDLLHDHTTTAVTRITAGKSSPTSLDGEAAITALLTEPAGVTYGYVMSRLIDEAQDVERGCIPAVSYTFTDTLDSDGEEWSVSLPIVRYRDGEQLGDVAMQGTQQFQADCQMLPDLELGLYDDLGEVSGVELTDGTARVVAARIDGRAPTATVFRIETEGGFGWSPDVSPRRESLATFGTASSVDEVESSIVGVLDDAKGTVQQTIVTSGPTGARPYVDYTVGDFVSVREIDGVYRSYRVERIAAELDDEVNVLFTVDVERRL